MSLNNSLYSKQGALDRHRYELREVNKEKRRIEEQLARIRSKGVTTGGVLPPRSVLREPPERVSSARSTETEKSKEENPHNTVFPTVPGSRRSRQRASIADMDLAAAKERVAQRLSERTHEALERRKSCASDDESETEEERMRTPTHNPDGSLRTVFLLPDFRAAYREAKKARYLRTRGKQWFEKELSIRDIFDKSLKEKTHIIYSPFE
jgi:hypothetical protein